MQLVTNPLGLAVGSANGKPAISIIDRQGNPVMTFIMEIDEAKVHAEAVMTACTGLIPAGAALVKGR